MKRKLSVKVERIIESKQTELLILLLNYNKYSLQRKLIASDVEGWILLPEINSDFQLVPKKEEVKPSKKYTASKLWLYLQHPLMEYRHKKAIGKSLKYVDLIKRKSHPKAIAQEKLPIKNKIHKTSGYRIRRTEKAWIDSFIYFLNHGKLKEFLDSDYCKDPKILKFQINLKDRFIRALIPYDEHNTTNRTLALDFADAVLFLHPQLFADYLLKPYEVVKGIHQANRSIINNLSPNGSYDFLISVLAYLRVINEPNNKAYVAMLDTSTKNLHVEVGRSYKFRKLTNGKKI